MTEATTYKYPPDIDKLPRNPPYEPRVAVDDLSVDGSVWSLIVTHFVHPLAVFCHGTEYNAMKANADTLARYYSLLSIRRGFKYVKEILESQPPHQIFEGVLKLDVSYGRVLGRDFMRKLIRRRMHEQSVS